MIEFTEAGKIFYAMKLNKHYSLANYNVSATSIGGPDDVVVLDQYFSIMVFGPAEFTRYFGKERFKMVEAEFQQRLRNE